ncbi:hypothetical protein LPB136_01950 [Tenacibaculum todarodis]|uniref:Peptidylprolyl isomerase n=1 Tax=Tenacibaculum todarodis TaxID=1850252 RepID=A0A1L3JGF5_9FLAO|nr:hypothetical protein [Tenacibaculum todarodis]APG64202.1 hypothetical protein LPB136_01950 [Tenacibaculum todarodis]
MKKIVCIVVCFVFLSCDYLGIQSKKAEEIETPIATVYNASLYKKDIENFLPKNITKEDSVVLVKSFINSWAKQQLFLKKAELNATEANNENINSLVSNYRESLFINEYKERLIKQELDTLVLEDEIEEFYKENKENFKLNEELIQLKYLHFGSELLDKKGIVKKFKSSKEEDLESLESQRINFKSSRLRDSTWLSLDNVLLKIPPFAKEPKEKLLKISKFIQKEDSLDVYLVAVKNVLKRNDLAPLSYITPQIKQLILHKRKLELIREIEKTLINDAIQNENFKEY